MASFSGVPPASSPWGSDTSYDKLMANAPLARRKRARKCNPSSPSEEESRSKIQRTAHKAVHFAPTVGKEYFELAATCLKQGELDQARVFFLKGISRNGGRDSTEKFC